MTNVRLLALGIVLAGALALQGAAASASSSRLELKSEGKALLAGGEALLVAGYSLNGCYFEEQELKVAVNGAATDRLTHTGEAGLAEGCDGGARTVEISSSRRLTVKLAPLRIHLTGPCVYEFKEISGKYQQQGWGPEIAGTATGTLYKRESERAGCAARQRSSYDIALIGVETALT